MTTKSVRSNMFFLDEGCNKWHGGHAPHGSFRNGSSIMSDQMSYFEDAIFTLRTCFFLGGEGKTKTPNITNYRQTFVKEISAKSP